MTANIVTAGRLRELLAYNPETGVFTRRVSRGRAGSGVIAGGLNPRRGYLYTQIDGRKYLVHRIAWLWVYGKWPSDQIDHANCIKTDNRIANLREATSSQNQQNQHKAHSNSKSGLLGAYWHARMDKWQAAITINRKQIYLGYFHTAEGAHQAYLDAKRALHRGFCAI